MISIIMAYFNRRQLLINTLQSIERSAIKDIEVIIVDDASKPEERIDDLPLEFPFIKLIRVKQEDKWYICNCMPMNRGIAAAKGDIIVLQNPECLHVQDVLSYITEHLTEDNFLSISTYAFNSKNVHKLSWMIEHFNELPQQRYERDLGWYNHPVFRPVYFHFCTALTKKNMDALGGFDERYAMGIARDDAEFVDRVDRLGLQKSIPTEVSVIHQWHSKVESFHEINYSNNIKKNKTIYELLTAKETSIKKENSYCKKAANKVTIIIPYKVDRGWLQEAIDSVPEGVQILVSQGEGTWAQNFNKALPEVTGEYVKFLHEDDMLPPNCIEDSVKAIEEQRADFIHGNAYAVRENGELWEPYISPSEISYDSLCIKNTIHGGSLLYRKRIFDLLGGFNEELAHGEEYDFNLRCLKAGFKLGYCDSILYYYRQHSGQKSKAADIDWVKVRKDIVDRI